MIALPPATRTGLVATAWSFVVMLALGACVVWFDTTGAFRAVPGYGLLYQFDRKAIYMLALIAGWLGWEQGRGRVLPPPALATLRLLTLGFGVAALVLLLARLAADAAPFAQIAAWWLAAVVLAAPLLALAVAAGVLTLRGRISDLGRGPHIVIVLVVAQLLFTSATFRALVQGKAVAATLSLSSVFYARLFGQSIVAIDVGATISPLVVAGDFAARIDPSCSGIIGLVIALLAFTAFFALEGKRLRLWRTLGLVVGTLVAIFLANALRIALLMRIGASGRADIAVSGFHSHFGLLSLMLLLGVALVLLDGDVFRREPRVRMPRTAAPTVSTAPAYDPLPALWPLAIYLLAEMLLGLVGTGFDWLYPLRTAIGLIVLVPVCRRFDWRCAWPIDPVDVLCGLFVFAVWIALVPADAEASEAARASLAAASPAVALGWVVVRALGAAVVIPLLEELAFRRGLQDWITAHCGIASSQLARKGLGLVASSVAFSALHVQLLAALLASLAYGALYARRGNLGSAVVAHVVTNAALASYVIALGQWSYW